MASTVTDSMKESEVDVSVKTRLPPCCLRIFENRFVLVGTYHLDKESGQRTGSLDLFDENLQLLKSFPTLGAVLDLKLSPYDNQLFATAHSTGNVTIWKISIQDFNFPSIEAVANLQIFDTKTLITSLHFSPLDSRLLLVTNTAGESACIDIVKDDITFSSDNVVDVYSKVESNLHGVLGCATKEPELFLSDHSLECWTSEFGSLQPLQNVVFTGGDDATIIAHDLRCKELIWSNNRIHEAGVVSIKCSTPNFRSSLPTSIVTGSYDDHIRLIELRMMSKDSIYPGQNTPVSKIWSDNLGGGVWRFNERPKDLRLTPSFGTELANEDQLLVCCMYNGAKIISMKDDKPTDSEVFTEVSYLKKGHESMCYGGDWCKDFIVTCSFYDNSLQRWNP